MALVIRNPIRRTAVGFAVSVCLAALSPVALAQNVSGALAGHATAGDTITITNTATGLSRTATVSADGSYRFTQLPVGDYSLSVSRGGYTLGSPLGVTVPLGGTAVVNLEGGDAELEAATVTGTRIANSIDVRSTELATNVTREELLRLPVDSAISAVALLAPGVQLSGAFDGELTFNGATVAENVIYINGLDVTDPYRRRGYSSVPFAFYKEFQVKTGGYSAEFGRSTGGVINAITRSGSNRFEGGVEVTLEPYDFHSSGKDHYYKDGTVAEVYSRDESAFYKYNVWASGPIIEDKLFFFGMYERRENKSQGYGTSGTASFADNGNDFYGGKIDWQINDDHRLELLGFSDKADYTTDRYSYDWDSNELGALGGSGLSSGGGDNWSATYTGHLTGNFIAKAMYGVNKRSAIDGSVLDDQCSIVSWASGYRNADYFDADGEPLIPVGCHPTNTSKAIRHDKREAARLDFEWTLGQHLVRFGFERSDMSSVASSVYPNDGLSYTAYTFAPGAQLDNGATVPAGVTEVIRVRQYDYNTPTSTVAKAFYAEDNWNITPDLLVNLGLRFDSFSNEAAGTAFTKSSFGDMVSPRLGFSWDMKGNGTLKLFGNAGRYYLPMTNKAVDYMGGGLIDERSFYVLNGWQEQVHPVTGEAYIVPVVGAEIGTADTGNNVTPPDDLREVVARNLRQAYQDEFILGFQQALGGAWSWGANATYRKLDRAAEDMRITGSDCSSLNSITWVIANPGETNTFWCAATNDWITVDTAEDGYIMGGTRESVGYPRPKRRYKSLELQLDRKWDDRWSMNFSYLLSRSTGNFEGPVNSELLYGDTGIVQYFDTPAANERYGVLFNDSRHQFKLNGSYRLTSNWSVGGRFSLKSGAPITAYGVSWPGDTRAIGSTSETNGSGSGWLCVANCTGTWDQWELERTERGAFGRLPWMSQLDLNLNWDMTVRGIKLKGRFNVYNVLDSQTTMLVHTRYERTRGVMQPHFGESWGWQTPRYMQLVFSASF